MPPSAARVVFNRVVCILPCNCASISNAFGPIRDGGNNRNHTYIGWKQRCSRMPTAVTSCQKERIHHRELGLMHIGRNGDEMAPGDVDRVARQHQLNLNQREIRPLVAIVAGPTGVGKSDVAALICHPERASKILHSRQLTSNPMSDHNVLSSRKASGHIISADSVQAYKGVNIGANKPSEEVRTKIPHHLIDVIEPSGQYSAANWMNDCTGIVDELCTQTTQDIGRQHFLPIVVGGTMMYIQWLVYGMPDAPCPSPEAVRRAASIIEKYQSMNDSGWDNAVQEVAEWGDVFKARTEKLGRRDWYRLRRTVEVALSSKGQNENDINTLFNGLRMNSLESLGYDVRCFFLCPDDRMKHAEIIDRRCEIMLTQGLLTETANLYISGMLPVDGQPSRAIGYRQALDYLMRDKPKANDVESLTTFLESFKTATRQYAKKQMQWFRRDKKFVFVPMSISESPSIRVENAARIVSEMCCASRGCYDEALEWRDDGVDDDALMHFSARTKKGNEEQGKSMKFYLSKRYLLVDGSPCLLSLLREADGCTALMQGVASL